MTHTLHRQGDVESLCEDCVLLVMTARGINREGSGEKMRRIWEIISHHGEGLVNYGNLTSGNSHRVSLDALRQVDSMIIHAVFTERESLRNCLRELKQADEGISVTVSGLYDEVREICSTIGLSPHTVNLSLGVHGKTSELPPGPILEITTMCGHALVAPSLVERVVEDLKEGRMTHADGARKLSRMCVCGIFNPERAERLLRGLAPDT